MAGVAITSGLCVHNSLAYGSVAEVQSAAAAARNRDWRSPLLKRWSGLGVLPNQELQWRVLSACARDRGGTRSATRLPAGGCNCRSEHLEESLDEFGMDDLNKPSGVSSFGSVFDPESNIPEAPPEFLEREEERIAEMADQTGVSIRRHPASGPHTHNCGDFQFKLQNEGNTPRNILEEIVWNKDVEVVKLKEKTSSGALMKAIKAMAPTRDFVGALRESFAKTGQPALIAEVKKASPSRGVIQPNFDPLRIAQAYESGGAACLSVLTDSKYFQGSFEYLKLIRDAGVQCPLLCKEFIIDAWQLLYARAHGADAVLLIAAILRDEDLRYFSKIASGLGLAVLVEVHNEKEMQRVLGLPNVQLIGINNRDLATFKVDLNNTVELLGQERRQKIAEKGILVVGESGIFTPNDIKFVQNAGVGAVLVGESLVKQNDPVAAIKALYGREIAESSKAELEVAASA